jgi:hypothetical protein
MFLTVQFRSKANRCHTLSAVFEEIRKFLLLAFVGFNNGRSSDYLTMLSVLMTGWLMNLEQLVEWEFTGEAKVLEENPPQCHFIPQVLEVLTWDWTEASVMESHWLTAWTMTQLVMLVMAVWFLLTLDVCCTSVATQNRNMIVYLQPHAKPLHLWKF